MSNDNSSKQFATISSQQFLLCVCVCAIGSNWQTASYFQKNFLILPWRRASRKNSSNRPKQVQFHWPLAGNVHRVPACLALGSELFNWLAAYLKIFIKQIWKRARRETKRVWWNETKVSWYLIEKSNFRWQLYPGTSQYNPSQYRTGFASKCVVFGTHAFR